VRPPKRRQVVAERLLVDTLTMDGRQVEALGGVGGHLFREARGGLPGQGHHHRATRFGVQAMDHPRLPGRRTKLLGERLQHRAAIGLPPRLHRHPSRLVHDHQGVIAVKKRQLGRRAGLSR